MSEGPTFQPTLQAMKEVDMKLLLATLSAILLFVPDNALPQIRCFGYAGGMTSCNGPRSNTLITPLSPSQGIIQGDRDKQSYMEPYTIFPLSFSSRGSFSPRGDGSFSSRPTEPLNRLDGLDHLDSFDDWPSRDRGPLGDPLLPLFLEE